MDTRVRTRNEGATINSLTLGQLSTGTVFKYSDPSRESCIDSTHRGPPYYTGGGLTLKRSGYSRQPSPNYLLNGVFGSWYNGAFISSAWGSNPTSSSYPFLDEAVYLVNHSSDGATAWKRFKPGKPVLDLGQDIVELRQIPSIPQLKASVGIFKSLGQNYLNYEFGWRPFVRELKKSLDVVLKVQDKLERLKRNNGSWVRKRGVLEDVMGMSTSVESEVGYPLLASQYFQDIGNQGTRTVRTFYKRRRWFSAKWRYWIPDIHTAEGERRIIRKLIGLDVTPGLFWEVLPWSWLADWFSNIGDVLDNVSGNAAENLVARYAYNMSSYHLEDNIEGIIRLRTRLQSGAYEPRNIPVEGSRYYDIKLRSAANPFGFGLTFDSLSDRQMLILAALGVSRR